MKNLIIGAFSGYRYETIRPWVKSAKLAASQAPWPTQTEIVLCVGQTDVETLEQLALDNITLVNMNEGMNGVPVHVFRFVYIYEFLRLHHAEYNHVVTTDVRDVVFQKDPFAWIRANIGSRNLIAASESMLYRDEPWGNNNLYETYGPTIWNQFKDNEIYNVGTLGGTSEYIKDLAFSIAMNSINRPIPIVDQAVYNVMIQTQPFRDATLFVPMDMGWACQAGTTVDPHKIDQFRPHLLGPEPFYTGGQVYTSSGEPFTIVHQYDRVPAWKATIEAKYA